jgi:hypothetical protein
LRSHYFHPRIRHSRVLSQTNILTHDMICPMLGSVWCHTQQQSLRLGYRKPEKGNKKNVWEYAFPIP